MNMFSVIIPTTSFILLEYAMMSLEMQRYKSFEVIVSVSTDDAKEIGKIESVVAKYPFAHTVYPSKTRSRAAARNKGIRAAMADTLLFIDQDMLLNPLFMSKLFYLVEHEFLSNYLALAWRTVIEPGQSQKMLRGEIDATYFKKWLLDREPEWDGLSYDVEKSSKKWENMISNNLCAPKSFIEKNGLYFDEEFEGWGEEDLDWSYRAHLLYATFIFYDNPCWHVAHDFSCSERTDSFIKNSTRMIKKHPGVLAYRHASYKHYGVNVDNVIKEINNERQCGST